jgi:hypothetical protein
MTGVPTVVLLQVVDGPRRHLTHPGSMSLAELA